MSNDKAKVGFLGRSRIYIGRFTYGYENLEVRQWNEGASLQIGSFCSLANNITIFLGGNHRVDWITTFPFGHIFQDELGLSAVEGHPATNGDVIVGNDVWIGAGSTIMSGVKIGDGAVLAANSCITKNVMPYHIAGGNPARSIKPRFESDIIEILLSLKWWDFEIEIIKDISRLLCQQPSKHQLLSLLHTYRG